MIRKTVIIKSLIGILLLTAGAVSAATATAASSVNTDRGAATRTKALPEKVNGRIVSIVNNKITLKDQKGMIRIFEVSSVKGIRIGDTAWCEEDCGRLRLADKSIRVLSIK